MGKAEDLVLDTQLEKITRIERDLVENIFFWIWQGAPYQMLINLMGL